jgi:hypothetical protein
MKYSSLNRDMNAGVVRGEHMVLKGKKIPSTFALWPVWHTTIIQYPHNLPVHIDPHLLLQLFSTSDYDSQNR